MPQRFQGVESIATATIFSVQKWPYQKRNGKLFQQPAINLTYSRGCRHRKRLFKIVKIQIVRYSLNSDKLTTDTIQLLNFLERQAFPRKTNLNKNQHWPFSPSRYHLICLKNQKLWSTWRLRHSITGKYCR